MHEALCRPSGTTLDTCMRERAADHSANIGSRRICYGDRFGTPGLTDETVSSDELGPRDQP